MRVTTLCLVLMACVLLSVTCVNSQQEPIRDYCQGSRPYTRQPSCRELNALQDIWHNMGGTQWRSTVSGAQRWFNCFWASRSRGSCGSSYDDDYVRRHGPCGSGSGESSSERAWFGVICDAPRSENQNYRRHIETLLLPSNDLTGTLPDSISGLTMVEQLFLFKNSITGSIPNGLFDMTRLTHLYLQDNQMTSLSSSNERWSRLSRLEKLYFDNNQITSSLEFIPLLTNLAQVNGTNNQLSGPLPLGITTMTKLVSFYMNDNQLTGPVPTEVINAPALRFFMVGNNKLSGPIPNVADTSNSQLLALDLSHNHLQCRLPPFMEFVQYPIDVRHNTMPDDETKPGFYCPVDIFGDNVRTDSCSRISQTQGDIIRVDIREPQKPAHVTPPPLERPSSVILNGEGINTACPVQCHLAGYGSIGVSDVTPTSVTCDLNSVDFTQFPTGFRQLCIGQDGRPITTQCTPLYIYNDCNGLCLNGGSCNELTGKCVCPATHQGEFCESLRCPPCNLGTCDGETGTCVCPPGYHGGSCQNTEVECELQCVHGTCNKFTGTCSCNTGWVGDLCDIPRCPPCFPEGSEDDCVNGQCVCLEGYSGTYCNILTIECEHNCNATGHGYCNTRTGQCICDPGHYGDECQFQHCGNCGDRGTCNPETGVCECDEGFTGPTCAESALCSTPDPCEPNGRCSGLDGSCICRQGFKGEFCEEETCYLDCNGVGECDLSTGTCTCPEGWLGDFCTIPNIVCDPPDCHGNGVCDTTKGECICYSVQPPFINANCSQRACPGTPECNNNGDCDRSTGECQCHEPYFGNTCLLRGCPEGCGDVVGTDCHENEDGLEQCEDIVNGVCDLNTGVCVCHSDYWGDNCKFMRCPNNCGNEQGWGTCDGSTGTCDCDEWYEGADCSVEKPDIVGMVVAIVLAVVLTLLVIVGGFLIWRHVKIQEIKKKNAQNEELEDLNDDEDSSDAGFGDE